MKSSKRRSLPAILAPAALAVLSASAIATVRPRLAADFHKVHVTTDSYALPAPEQTVVASLGYRAALADLIWAHVLVSYGVHFEEKRRFEFVGDYLDTINALDPKFSEPYRLADTLLTLQPEPPTLEDYKKARQILERGMQELPDYTELWQTAGQFMAYLAAPQLGSAELTEEWRLEGARRLARACELPSSNENTPYNCITAAGLFSRAGKLDALRSFAERLLTVSDNPEIREKATMYLKTIASEEQRDQVIQFQQEFQELWGKDLSFISKTLFLILSPPRDSALCAGAQGTEKGSECASSWRVWGDGVARAVD